MQPLEWQTPPLKHGFGWQDISGVVFGGGNVTSALVVGYTEAINESYFFRAIKLVLSFFFRNYPTGSRANFAEFS